MRILAIRGCNLASLAGEFEIDLVHGPLGGAGVFAIVGPTGAGKSTLLDAMCVALFDRTPRLANRSQFQVGSGPEDPAALGSQDVRTLLRRGASAGWAEVDFESGDARRYRARWSVRRARGSTDGNLQDQQVTLTAMDSTERLGGTKMETLKAIHQRLGLTFDQFRRSALLAQGDFAAFLRADGKDRSELLERMTGTEIYSKLSVAAHVRATEAEQALRERHGAAAAIAVMSDEARAAAEAELVAANEARERARTRLAQAETIARWRTEAAARAGGLAEAEGQHHAATAAAHEAEPLRAELALRRRAEALRGTWDDAARVDRQHAIARGELGAAMAAVEQATAASREIADLRARLAELHAPIRAARIAAGIVERATPRTFVTVETVALAAADDAAWLVARRTLASEIAAWPELEAKLAQYRTLAEGIAAADTTLGERAHDREGILATQKRIASAREAAQARLAEATHEVERYHGKRGITLDAAGRAEDVARKRRDDFVALIAIAAGARSASAARAELDMQLAELDAVETSDGERRAITQRERDAAQVLRDERLRSVTELRKVAGFAHARTELVDGEPCPLCGGEDHPWRDRGTVDAMIAEAERAHAESATSFEAAHAQLAQLATRAAQRATDRARIASMHATVTASAETSARSWRDQLAALGELVLVGDPSTKEAEELAAERAEVATARLDDARKVRSEAVAAAKAISDAQARVQVCQADFELRDAELQALAGALATLDAEVAGVNGERAAKVERHAELAIVLDAAIARWAAALPASDRARLGTRSGTAKRAKRPTAAEIISASRRLEPEISRDVLAELAAAWKQHSETVAAADAMLVAALAEIDRTALEGERAVVDTTARHAELARRCADLARDLTAAGAALDDARIAAGFDRDELQRLFGEPGQVDRLAEQVEEVARAVDRARTRVAERRRLVDDHAMLRPQHGDEADADRIEELAVAVTAADHHAAALAAALAGDLEARKRREAAFAQFAAAERAAEIDRVLGEVIGSHDGKLFRSFAQSLTLDGLLAVANSHLEELAPRYQLERVPKHDLELQVLDRDFGGEVRSVQSLSGGESFLVSLALALGLSSMSAHDVRVRTLLIDEGFGTLDPATLDSALAVLDELQATGRQVGIISHVPALLDRVRAHVRVAPRGGGRSEVVIPPS